MWQGNDMPVGHRVGSRGLFYSGYSSSVFVRVNLSIRCERREHLLSCLSPRAHADMLCLSLKTYDTIQVLCQSPQACENTLYGAEHPLSARGRHSQTPTVHATNFTRQKLHKPQTLEATNLKFTALVHVANGKHVDERPIATADEHVCYRQMHLRARIMRSSISVVISHIIIIIILILISHIIIIITSSSISVLISHIIILAILILILMIILSIITMACTRALSP